jgi:predicted permease
MTFRDLKLRVLALLAPRRVEDELDEELRFHLERETQKHIANGQSPAEARIRALARFGSVALAADQCRDVRGTAFFDALIGDIRYAFRAFRRARLAALTIVATVALGLGLVAVVFTFYSALFLRLDAVRSPGELFAVERPPSQSADVRVPMMRSEYDALQRETSVFSDAFARLPSSIGTRVDGRMARCTLVTGNFFQVLGVNAALGRTLSPADDERFAGRPVIVLSHRGWSKLFANDPTVVGRSLMVSGFRYEIAGVMPEGFRGLGTSPPDYWAPLSLLGQFRPGSAGKEDEVALDVVGRLKPGLSAETATAGLNVWASRRTDLKTGDDRRATIRLTPKQGTLSTDVLEALLVFSPLFLAFGLILMIGCANVANLQLARGVARQREIGIRLSLGASRSRIIRQLLTESLLLALASAACGLAISRLILEAGIYAAVTTMPPEIAEQVSLVPPAADWRVAAFLLAGALVSTVFFGLMPALQATRLELVRTMRGELTRDARPSRARNALIALQVGASALLLICAAVFLRSAFAAAAVDTGLRTRDTVILPIANEPLRSAILHAVRTDPAIAAVAASWPAAIVEHLPSAVAEAMAFGQLAADKPTTAARVAVGYKFVSPEYFSVLDIGLVNGRGFTAAERTADAGVAIVSETTARRLWPNGGAVGQILRIEADPASAQGREDDPPLPSRTFSVVGVVRDVRGTLLVARITEAAVYLPTAPESPRTSLTLRVHGDPEQARRVLLERLTKVDPAMGELTTMRTVAGMEAYFLRIAFWVAVVLGGLALVLTLSGLFSVLSYIVEQRRKEIGVRMTLGATAWKVAGLVLSQLLRPVSLGLMTGSGLAAGLAIVTMSISTEMAGLVHGVDPVAYAASLLVIVTACVLAASIPTLRAARIDPMTTLRQE